MPYQRPNLAALCWESAVSTFYGLFSTPYKTRNLCSFMQFQKVSVIIEFFMMAACSACVFVSLLAQAVGNACKIE